MDKIQFNVKRPREPFTDGRWKDGDEKLWAKCDAYHQIKFDISRYVRGEVKGKSLLVAGHRGSGKSMLTLLAIQELQRSCPTGAKAFPIPIVLHGPTLLQEKKTLHRSFGELGPEERLAQNVLHEIVRALHRCLCEELASRYELKASTNGDQKKKEAAARLRLELDQTPGVALLRRFWAHAGALESGVLEDFQGGRPSRKGEKDSQTKGLREILAIYTATEALRILERGLDQPNAGAAADAEKLTREELINLLKSGTPLLSFIPGGLIAFSLAEKMGVWTAITLGLFVAVMTNELLRRITGSIARPTLGPDGSISSLERLVPLLVERTFDAGIAPIFIVDELDKVHNLDRKMETLIQYLRHFVSDYAFFCFLADRSYFERLATRIREKPYTDELTYFGERILLYYKPEDMHEHLKTCLTPTNEKSDNGQALTLLRLLMLQMSRSHPGNLWQLIENQPGADGTIELEGDQARRRSYLKASLMQAAVEQVFRGNKDLQRLMNISPEITQFVLDALYYPSDQWSDGQPIVLSERKLEDHLLNIAGAPRGRLKQTEVRQLLAGVKELVEMVRRPQEIWAYLSADRLSRLDLPVCCAEMTERTTAR